MLSAAAVGLLCSACGVYQPQSPFQQAYRAHALPSAPVPVEDLGVQWFGVSTLLFRQAGQAILIDGFFSRPGPWRTVFGNLAPDPAAIRAALAAGHGPVAAVFVAHAHHDHALDAPALARDWGITLYGSNSVLNLARGYQVPGERLRSIVPGSVHQIAGFGVRAVPTPHAPSIFPSADIERPLGWPLHALGFSAGRNYSFLIRRGPASILVVPSAGAPAPGAGDVFGLERAGIVFLGIGGLGKADAGAACSLWEAYVRQRGARMVVLIHWDAFTLGLHQPLRPFSWPVDDAGRAYRLLDALAREDGVALRFIRPVRPVNLSALALTPLQQVPARRDCAWWAFRTESAYVSDR